MKCEFSTSNLSKIATKFRTSGNISQPRRKAGSPLKDIGMTDVKQVKCATPESYIRRLYEAYDKTEDVKLKEFIFSQIRDYHIKRGVW
jgi:hypothetical protein